MGTEWFLLRSREGPDAIRRADDAVGGRHQAQRERRDHVDDPLGFCMPPGVPRIDSVDQFKIIQTPAETVFLHEAQVGPHVPPGVHRTDVRCQRIPSRRGFWLPIGRWDGDTFVVDTVGLRGMAAGSIRGRPHPHSDALHVTERFRRIDFEAHGTGDHDRRSGEAYHETVDGKDAPPLPPDTELLESFL